MSMEDYLAIDPRSPWNEDPFDRTPEEVQDDYENAHEYDPNEE